MAVLNDLRRAVIGAPLDPLNTKTRHSIALISFFAWVGLGADGLSSSCYGPEEAFRALGPHAHLGLYLAIATAVTVFIISLAYNQVIELFPTGGGGYRVSSRLIGKHAGLVSGAALILDYVLTIAISIASGVDALFSLLPLAAQHYKLACEVLLVGALVILNLRGMKEVIKVLLPVFLGFVLTHVLLVVYGVIARAERLPALIPDTLSDTRLLASDIGWTPLVAMLLLAYAQGGGTYTGLEAVSNNVNVLAEPRVRTGKLTMFYMALSLSFMAAGIILVYLLWDARPVEGQTLNAVVFGSILGNLNLNPTLHQILLTSVLILEGGLLFVAANTGFLGGPAVLSNMAVDSWVPHQFRYLSTRLVGQNGILMLGGAAVAVLMITKGHVAMLVVLYSISVFLTFSISLFGLCLHWYRERKTESRWRSKLALAASGTIVCSGILVLLSVQQFTAGGWLALLILAGIVGICLAIRHHYDHVRVKLLQVDQIFIMDDPGAAEQVPTLHGEAPTAVFLVGSSRGGAMHTMLWVQRLFPGHFKNFLFMSARAVDAHSYGGSEDLAQLQKEATRSMGFLVNFCHQQGLASDSYLRFAIDPVEELYGMAREVSETYTNAIFFTSKLIFEHDNWLIRMLHNQAALSLQRRLHLAGMQMVILPMKL